MHAAFNLIEISFAFKLMKYKVTGKTLKDTECAKGKKTIINRTKINAILVSVYDNTAL